jgi:hypothetical protein
MYRARVRDPSTVAALVPTTFSLKDEIQSVI